MLALRRHSDSVDVCTFAMQCLDLSGPRLPQRSFSSAEVECLVSAIRISPSCHALQRHGFSFLAQLLAANATSPQSTVHDEMLALPGGGLARIITRLGVAELALSALLSHQDDQILFHDVCFLLQKLAPSSREVKLPGAERLLGGYAVFPCSWCDCKSQKWFGSLTFAHLSVCAIRDLCFRTWKQLINFLGVPSLGLG